MQSAIGIHKGKWYKPVNGIPTGGSISVPLANIAVHYVLYLCVYSNNNLMTHIHAMKRFIDDGVGLFNGTIRQFDVWKTEFMRVLAPYNLLIKPDDWQVAIEPGITIHFLDIEFTFSFEGKLVTDIHIKETDSRTYLNFHSHHPPYIFSSIIYSQALRYRRIINNEDIFNNRLKELYKYLRISDFPHKMITNIFDKVKNTPRNLMNGLPIVQHQLQPPVNVPPQPTPPVLAEKRGIRVISTFGRDEKLCEIVNSIAPMLVENKITSKIQFVKKTGPSLKGMLSNSKRIALKNKFGYSVPCNRGNGCKNCPLMTLNNSISSSHGKVFYTAPGDCLSRNIIYAATCQICHKNYVGRTTQVHSSRNNGHRAKFVRYGKQIAKGVKMSVSDLDDEYTLGIHLHDDHKIKDKLGFDNNFKFTILENCSPKDLPKKEHMWIQKMRSIYPFGLNLNSPFGLPLLS